MTNLEKEAWDYSDSQRTAYDDDRATAYAKGYIAGATRQATKPRLRDWARELYGSRKMLIHLAETRSVDLAPHIKTKDGRRSTMTPCSNGSKPTSDTSTLSSTARTSASAITKEIHTAASSLYKSFTP